MEAYAIQLDEIEDKALIEFLTQLEAQQNDTKEERGTFVAANEGTVKHRYVYKEGWPKNARKSGNAYTTLCNGNK